MAAVIDKKAFDRIKNWIDYAKNSSNLTIIAGGKYDERFAINLFHRFLNLLPVPQYRHKIFPSIEFKAERNFRANEEPFSGCN